MTPARQMFTCFYDIYLKAHCLTFYWPACLHFLIMAQYICSVGSGALPALGSYNKFHHNCYRDALITCVVNTCTCLTAGVLVFSILGHMAHINQLPIANVVRSGPGLVFLTYPELVLSLPASFFWAAIFFIMLLVCNTYSPDVYQL